jgi:hypothetical protein
VSISLLINVFPNKFQIENFNVHNYLPNASEMQTTDTPIQVIPADCRMPKQLLAHTPHAEVTI